MGVRVKRIAGVGVKVYACGLYVDPSAARAAVGDAYVGRKVSDVAKDQSLFATLLNDAKVEKTARLVFARDLDSAKVSDALSERLRPALGAGSASLRAFESHFEGVQFKKGQSLTFSAVGGKLHTSIQGKEVGAIADPELCVALFDAYLGKDPVVPGGEAEPRRTARQSRHGVRSTRAPRSVGCERWEGGGRDETPSTVCNASDVSTRRTTVCRRRRGADDVLGRVEGEGAFARGSS